MKFSVITANYNGERFLGEALASIVEQKSDNVDVEIIVIDGQSTDNSLAIVEGFGEHITHLVVEKDSGPANAINKGFALASGDVVSWLNSDDRYSPGALRRVAAVFAESPGLALCFGRCPIIDENGTEIRKMITRFKEMFFPLSSRFTFQCINYISQPTLFFSSHALRYAAPLREDFVAAWDYDFMLRLWKSGGGAVVPGGPLAAFRWHQQSISGQNFRTQFKEELDSVKAELGPWKAQVLLHHMVRWGIVGAYSAMENFRLLQEKRKGKA